RIVFWNDPDLEFAITLSLLNLPEGVNILRLDQMSALEAKIRLEREDPEGRYLVYAPTEEPDYEADWLLDIRLYSQSFRADRASMILDELGLANQHLRDHIAVRRKFFDNQQRLQKLKEIVTPNDTDVDLDTKMIAVVVKGDHPEWFSIIRTLYHEFTSGGNGNDIDLDTPPAVWLQLEKFDLDEPFWRMAKSLLGYEEENPTLKNLLIRLLVTDFSHHLKGIVPDALAHFVLPHTGKSNTVVCLAQWRDSSSKGSSYDRLSDLVAGIIKMEDQLYSFEIEALLDVMTFQTVEKAIAQGLRNRVISGSDTIKVDDIRKVATQRQAGYWASSYIMGRDIPRKAYYAVYEALTASAGLFELTREYPDGFDYDTPGAMVNAYEKELFRFDQRYRHFCEQADIAESRIWDILKKLREKVESCYVNGYLQPLSDRWGKFIDPEGPTALMNSWRLDGIPNQSHFFRKHVEPHLKEAERRRSFVIISDAFRYEAAWELTRELNGKYRFEADLSAQLGVLPSYTALGMAALLPHEKLTYKPNGDVLVDGKPTAGLEQRSQILEAHGGLAVKADDLLEMKKEQGRAFIKDQRLLYIYHNVIDAAGDSAPTEGHTFEAVRRAIHELASVVSYIINNLNGHHVLITADHGFLFTESLPGEPHKSSLQDKPPGTVKAKQRFLMGPDLGDHDSVWHGATATTADAEGEMEFWIPKGVNRFHFMGGARFVHGGAMLQEIVVPVVTVRHRKDKGAGATKTKSVTVHVLGTRHKITTSRHRFEMIQMEPVSDRVKPITLKVGVYDGNDPVTTMESVTFESASDKLEERKKSITLVLQDRQYHKKTAYRLVLRDAETGVEQESVDVIIDRAFTDDF
ncbi:MAG: BREX-1 system phosphatase PglZ type A, partial [Deltaproteobacteria bacterium]|nr:BREX-1 system phosphatase PglZ type A [Deltaproteobacteria bacterium]